MKKKCILALILGAAFMAQGCGFTEGTDAVVTVVEQRRLRSRLRHLRQRQHRKPTAEAAADSAAADSARCYRADTKRNYCRSEG